MGTHSLIIMREKKSDAFNVYAVLYQQYDGDPNGVGAQLCRLLTELKISNGIPFGEKNAGIANGAGCLFAQIISYFKIEAGGAYLESPNNISHEEWNYYVDVSELDVTVTISNGNTHTHLFSGTPKECQTEFLMNPSIPSPREYKNHLESVLKKYNLK